MTPEGKPGLDGHALQAMFVAGADWLEKVVPDINALNVYPVPDGDCGTNMLFTIRESLDEAGRQGEGSGSASAFAQAVARGALLGARGNSGVILSQIWRGLAQGLEGRDVVDARDLAQALRLAAEAAYGALSHPVEGTILTVMRDAASAAVREAAKSDASAVLVLSAAVCAARASVMNTPNLLAVLKDAGVVDAGGHGLYTFLEGALLYLKGEMDGRFPELLSRRVPLSSPATPSPQESSYGFCTQFIVKGAGLNVGNMRRALEHLGESLIVVGDNTTARIHIHTHEPEAVTKLASTFGTVLGVEIQNMDEQHQDFLLLNKEKLAQSPKAVVAVVNSDALVNIFADLGVAAVVRGGQTMNPSTTEILRTLEEVPSPNIILLPNNKNVVPAAQLVRSLTDKNVEVIATETIPQGISALVAFDPEADLESSVAQMTDAMTAVRTMELTRATRASRLNNLDIREGQFIGLLDGELLAAGDGPYDVVSRLLARIDPCQAHVVTIYYGQDASETEADQIRAGISGRYPALEVGVVKGGQPNYDYIVSVE